MIKHSFMYELLHYHLIYLKENIVLLFFWKGVKMKNKVSPESVLSKSVSFWQVQSEACISTGLRHWAICQCQEVLNWVVKWIWDIVGLTQFNFITQEWLLYILWFQLAAVCVLPLILLLVLWIWMLWKKKKKCIFFLFCRAPKWMCQECGGREIMKIKVCSAFL